MENRENELTGTLEDRIAAMEEKAEKRSRTVIIIAAVTMLLVLTLAIFLWINVSSFMADVRPVMEAVDALDLEAVTDRVNELAAMDTEGLKKLSDYFASMDEEELAARMDGLQDALEIFSKLDVESLSEALENLSKTLEPLMKLFGGKG